MEFIQKRRILTFVSLVCAIFSLTLAFANENCEKNYHKFTAYLETSVCDIEKNEWLEKCFENKHSCFSGDAGLCIEAQFEECDKILNQTYKEAIRKAEKNEYDDEYNIKEGQEKDRLKQAELDWIKFRDSHCKVGVDFSGTGSRLGYANCRLYETKKRIKELQEYYIKPEGAVF